MDERRKGGSNFLLGMQAVRWSRRKIKEERQGGIEGAFSRKGERGSCVDSGRGRDG